MRKVIISIANDRLNSRRLMSSGLKKGKDNRYIALHAVGKAVHETLSELKICPVDTPVIDEKFKTKFLNEYIELIGSIGQKQRWRWWWATDIASKNRFASNISDYLQEFIHTMTSAQAVSCDTLLVINPVFEIVTSLQLAFRHMGIDCDIVGKRSSSQILSRCKSFMRRALSIPKSAIRVLIRRDYEHKKLTIRLHDMNNHQGKAYVIKTFIYPSSFEDQGGYRDAFFGKLPDFLKSMENVVLFGTIFHDFKPLIHKIKKCTSHTIIPVEYFLTFGDICSAVFHRLISRFDLSGAKKFFGYDVRSILSNDLRNTFNGIQFEQLLYYWATKRLLQNLKTKTFLMTYENNPWERMCTLAVKDHFPDTAMIGYQHTVVPQASANMFVSESERASGPIPDRIYTVGDEPRLIMEKYGHYPDQTIEASCALRFDYLFGSDMVQKTLSNKILVVLEGIFDVYHMVNYVVEQLHDTPEYEVRIRSHPVLPFTAIEHKITRDINGLQHIQHSTNQSLKTDLRWGDLIVYWGTTVALEAVKLGKPVIHYDNGSLLSYDPLFRCPFLKWTVDNSVSLRRTIEEIRAIDDSQLVEAQNKARAYLNSYFKPVDRQSMSKFIQY